MSKKDQRILLQNQGIGLCTNFTECLVQKGGKKKS